MFGAAVCCSMQSQRWKIALGKEKQSSAIRQYHYLQAHDDTSVFAVCAECVVSCISHHAIVFFPFCDDACSSLLCLHSPAWVEMNSLDSNIHLQLETNGALKACLSRLSPAWKISLPWLPFFQWQYNVALSALKEIVHFSWNRYHIGGKRLMCLLKPWTRNMFFIGCQHCT